MSGINFDHQPWEAEYGQDVEHEPSELDHMAERYKEHLSLWRVAQRCNPTIPLTGPPLTHGFESLAEYEGVLADWKARELEDPERPLDGPLDGTDSQ